MPIEFRCTQCNRLLRTGDDTAGKQAKCPECGAILTIPTPQSPSSGPAWPPPADPTPRPSEPAPTPGAGPTPDVNPFGPIDLPGAKPGPSTESPFARGATTGSPFGGGPAAADPFAGGTAADPDNPFAAPADYTTGVDPRYGQASRRITHTLISVGDVLGRTWDIYKLNWGMCLAALIIVVIVNMAVQIPISIVTTVLGAVVQDEAIAFTFSIIGNLAGSLFGVWLGIGQAMYFLKTARGQQPPFGELFRGGPYFFPVILAVLLLYLIFLGISLPGLALLGVAFFVPAAMFVAAPVLVLSVIPMMVVGLMFSQFYYLIIDQNVGVMESFSLSKKLTAGNKLTLFLIWFVITVAYMGAIFLVITVTAFSVMAGGIPGILVAVAIGLVCFIGAIMILPYFTMLVTVIYLSITGQPMMGSQEYSLRSGLA